MLFHLEKSSLFEDIRCPKCGTYYSVVWDTDYSEASLGDHSTECLECGTKFDFTVYVKYEVL